MLKKCAVVVLACFPLACTPHAEPGKPASQPAAASSSPKAVSASPAASPPAMVTVPEGQKVVVVRAAPRENIGMLESGLLVVDFGAAGSWKNLTSAIEKRAKQGDLPSLIVILQLTMIAELKARGELDAFFDFWARAHSTGARAVWVLPLGAKSDQQVVALIKKAGFTAHASADDGACFVEVHKPDGSITIGMPGPQL